MKLRNKVKALGTYTGKTKFDFWKNIEEGDVLSLETEISRAHTRGYAEGINIINIRTEETWRATFTECINYFSNLKHEEYQENPAIFTA